MLPPLQLTLDWEVAVAVKIEGWVIVTLAVAEHPLASVTVTVYVPADKPLIVWVVLEPQLLPHKYE